MSHSIIGCVSMGLCVAGPRCPTTGLWRAAAYTLRHSGRCALLPTDACKRLCARPQSSHSAPQRPSVCKLPSSDPCQLGHDGVDAVPTLCACIRWRRGVMQVPLTLQESSNACQLRAETALDADPLSGIHPSRPLGSNPKTYGAQAVGMPGGPNEASLASDAPICISSSTPVWRMAA